MDFKKLSKKINLDIEKNQFDVIDAKQGDIKSRYLEITLFNNGELFDTSDNNLLFTIYAIKPDGEEIWNDCIVEDGKIIFEFTSQFLAVPGMVKAEFVIIGVNVIKSINSENAIESLSEYNTIANLILDIEEAKKQIGAIGELNRTLLNNIQVGNLTNSTLKEYTNRADNKISEIENKLDETSTKIEEITDVTTGSIESINNKVAEVKQSANEMKELIDSKIEQANTTKDELQEIIDEAHGDFANGIETPTLLFKQEGKYYYPKFELTDKGLMIYADSNDKTNNYLLIPFDGGIKWNDNILYHSGNFKPQVIKFGGTTNGVAGIGYYSTDSCTYIANDSNNWLRLKDDGTITWKGKKIYTEGESIIVGSTINSNSNSSGNFHIVNSGATDRAGSVYVRAGVDLRVRDKESVSYVPIVASKFTVSSEEKWKDNVQEITENASDIINNATIYKYNLNGEEKESIGLIIDRDAPSDIITEVINEDGTVDKLIDLYGMVALAWKSSQEHTEDIDYNTVDLSGLILESAQKDSIITEQNNTINQLENDLANLMLEICK